MPASSSEDDLSSCLDELNPILDSRETGSTNIICGDHNGDVGGGVRFRGSRKATPAGKLIINLKAYHSWVQDGKPSDKDNPVRIEYLSTKREFNKRLHRLAREYEEEDIRQTISSASVDKNKFWRILKRNKNNNNQKTAAIKNKAGVVVHDVKDILEVWRD